MPEPLKRSACGRWGGVVVAVGDVEHRKIGGTTIGHANLYSQFTRTRLILNSNPGYFLYQRNMGFIISDFIISDRSPTVSKRIKLMKKDIGQV